MQYLTVIEPLGGTTYPVPIQPVPVKTYSNAAICSIVGSAEPVGAVPTQLTHEANPDERKSASHERL
jgi:hypothetical protein